VALPGLRIGAPPEAQLMQRYLLRSERVLVASPAYLARKPPIEAPLGLLDQDWLTYWPGPEDVVWRFLAGGGLQELRIQARFSSNNGEVLHGWRWPAMASRCWTTTRCARTSGRGACSARCRARA
jgi:DNA-binding transcriptional LysR family regulator